MNFNIENSGHFRSMYTDTVIMVIVFLIDTLAVDVNTIFLDNSTMSNPLLIFPTHWQ